MGHSIMNAMQDVTHWFHRTVTHDFFLWTVLPDVATGQSAEMPTALEAEIRMLAGVAHVDTVRCVSGAAAGQPVLFIVRGFGTPGFLSLNLHKGDPEAVRQRLVQGEVAIGTALAQKIGRHPGQTLNLDTPQGPRAVRIAGTVNEYTVNGMTIHIAREPARRLLAVEGIDALAIACQPGFRDQVEAALRALSAQHGLLFQSLADLRDELDRMTAGFVASLWALLVLGFVVADLGLVNTLTMNMLEQTRELGLLRVVGMTRGQLRRLTFAQAVLMAGIGAVPGVLAGFGMAYLLHLSATPLSGHPSPFQLVPLWLIGWPTGALLVGLLAAWLPAERAARLPPTEALKYE
jgi:putative ABC transport system permease protein